jgi:hypothetical protein
MGLKHIFLPSPRHKTQHHNCTIDGACEQVVVGVVPVQAGHRLIDIVLEPFLDVFVEKADFSVVAAGRQALA